MDFLYGSGTVITGVTDNAGRTVTYAYDTSQRLTSVTDVGGGVTEYTYDGSSRMATVKDARSIVFLTNSYDGASRVISQTQADGTTWHTLEQAVLLNSLFVQQANPYPYRPR